MSPQPNSPASSPARRAIVGIAVVLAVLVAIYGGGALHFSSHFVPGTTVNGEPVANMTADVLSAHVSDRVSRYALTLTGDGLELGVKASDITLSVQGDAYAQAAMSQVRGYAWPLDLVMPKDILVGEGVSFDDAALSEIVGSAVDAFNASAAPPTNSVSTYDASSGQFRISDAAVGTAIDRERAIEAARQAAGALRPTAAIDEGALVQPAVTADNAQLVSANDLANRMLALDIPITRGGVEVTHVTGGVICGWVSVAEDFSVNVDQTAIVQWANDTLAAQVASSDEEHDYAIDADAVAGALAQRITELDAGALEASVTVTETRPPESEGAASRGRHVDVNLSTQYARFYDTDGSVIWRSYLVSGNTSMGRGTPTGTFALNAKRTDEMLIGADENHDGQPDYKSHVNYWMPFVGNSVGLHDATWRSRFGGTIYAWNGSHGCVNLPYDDAERLYELINVGDTVYVHW
ncbi:ErfK/YbiS/YcfS/YnhG family protein [Olsenella uli DSM 7084]|uniref:ErfK/YbiS/YcfS/YnhG family protein n=2 Tax=Olsenella uli TaxID=133926 RepID=E1QVX9_OLSUV|nr:ErfK/YbiS/YcfS/YnhG family protein [Olsenella uli DSM 7084]